MSWAEGGPEHKCWPEDPNCKNLVTRFAKEDIHDSPPEGVYIHGEVTVYPQYIQ